MILCGILVASGIVGALIPFSSIVGTDNDIKGPTEAEATTATAVIQQKQHHQQEKNIH